MLFILLFAWLSLEDLELFSLLLDDVRKTADGTFPLFD